MLKLTISKIQCNSCISTNGEAIPFTMSWYNQLLSEIKEWRLNKSHLINLPPYCIFPDKTIHSIINILPTTKQHLWLVSGFNENIINNYGEDIIHIIKSFLNDKNIIDIIYSTQSFDLKNHKVKGILGYLGYLSLFNKEEIYIEEQPKIKENQITKKTESYKTSRNPEHTMGFSPTNDIERIELYDTFEVEFEDGEILQAQIIKPTDITVFEETGRRDGSSKFYRKKVRLLNPENCFSLDTPFAQAVLSKKLNQYFSYNVENILIKGKIIKIIKNKIKDY